MFREVIECEYEVVEVCMEDLLFWVRKSLSRICKVLLFVLLNLSVVFERIIV